MNVEIGALKIVQVAGESEDALRERGANLKSLRRGVFVELADVPCARAGLIDFDLDEFGEARFENLAVGDDRARHRGRDGGRT